MNRIENPTGVSADFAPARRILEHLAGEISRGASVLIMADDARSGLISAALGPLRPDCLLVNGVRDGEHPEYEQDGRFTATVIWGSLELCDDPAALVADGMRLAAITVMVVVPLRPSAGDRWSFEAQDVWRWFQKHEVRAHTVLARSYIVAAVNLRP